MAFADGEGHACSAAAAATLCRGEPLDAAAFAALDGPAQSLALAWLNRGHLVLSRG